VNFFVWRHRQHVPRYQGITLGRGNQAVVRCPLDPDLGSRNGCFGHKKALQIVSGGPTVLPLVCSQWSLIRFRARLARGRVVMESAPVLMLARRDNLSGCGPTEKSGGLNQLHRRPQLGRTAVEISRGCSNVSVPRQSLQNVYRSALVGQRR
jgi:hypothetical protein